jgi:hypothetical protein
MICKGQIGGPERFPRCTYHVPSGLEQGKVEGADGHIGLERSAEDDVEEVPVLCDGSLGILGGDETIGTHLLNGFAFGFRVRDRVRLCAESLGELKTEVAETTWIG